MVYAFFIQTVHPTSCEILYSEVFNVQSFADPTDTGKFEEGPVNPAQPDAPALPSRAQRTDALNTIAKRICTEYNFLCKVSKRSYENDLERLRNDRILPELETGAFLLGNRRVPPFFLADKYVIWCASLATAFVLVIEVTENRILANTVLKYMTKYLQDYSQALTNPSEVLLKPDIVMQVIRTLLPSGQLLFLNHKLIQQLEKDMEQKVVALISAR